VITLGYRGKELHSSVLVDESVCHPSWNERQLGGQRFFCLPVAYQVGGTCRQPKGWSVWRPLTGKLIGRVLRDVLG
jgi:hypothetical protein